MSLKRLNLLLWLGAGLAYAALIFWAGAKLIDAAGGDLPFDLRPFGLTFESARSYLELLGADGRALYAQYVMPVDTVFPVLMGLALALTAYRQARWLGVVLGLGYLVADLWENSVIAMVMSDPARMDLEVFDRIQMLTRAKFALFAAALALIVVHLWKTRSTPSKAAGI